MKALHKFSRTKFPTALVFPASSRKGEIHGGASHWLRQTAADRCRKYPIPSVQSERHPLTIRAVRLALPEIANHYKISRAPRQQTPEAFRVLARRRNRILTEKERRRCDGGNKDDEAGGREEGRFQKETRLQVRQGRAPVPCGENRSLPQEGQIRQEARYRSSHLPRRSP